MSESKHTPGPWEAHGTLIVVGKNTDDWGGFDIRNAPNPEANARLIAAAPELLEALEAIYRSINLPPGLDKKATEAIRKAKGE